MGQLNLRQLAAWWAVYTVIIVVVTWVSAGFFSLFGLVLSMLGAIPAALIITWRRRNLTGM